MILEVNLDALLVVHSSISGMPSESRPRRATRSRQKTTQEEEESDDPLALTPLRQSDRTQRRPVNSGHDGRLHRSVDRVIGGVEMAAGDLVPPSDEEEFDAWAAGLKARRLRVESSQMPSSPTDMVVSCDLGRLILSVDQITICSLTKIRCRPQSQSAHPRLPHRLRCRQHHRVP